MVSGIFDNRLILIIALLLCSVGIAEAQTIHGIRYEGLKRTKPSYLNQFLESAVGADYDEVIAEQDAQLFQNLEIFSRVTQRLTDEDGSNILVFDFKEVFTLIPIVNLGYDGERLWALAGASDVNVAGRGHKTSGFIQYDERVSIKVLSRWNRIRQSLWGVEGEFVKWSTNEPLYFGENTVFYEYDNLSYGLSGIRNYDNRSYIQVGANYFTEDYRAEETELNVPKTLSTRKTQLKFTWMHNRINYEYFLLEGWQNDFKAQTIFSHDGDPRFDIFLNETKYFKRFGRLNLAARFKLGLSTNNESPFAPFVLDSYLNIRGVGNRVDRGTGAGVLNIEARTTLFHRERMAAQFVLFSDLGTWRSPGADLETAFQQQAMVGYSGLGFRLIQPKIYQAILRLDIGTDLMNPGDFGFVFGLGQYF